MNTKLLSALAIVLLFTFCKKKEFPQNVSDMPDFYVNGTVNGKPINLTAGMFNYYMFSDYTQDSTGLYTFVANLQQNNCTAPCNNSIKIEIDDNKASLTGGASNITSSIKIGDYSFANPSQTTPVLSGYAVKYHSWFNNNAMGYSWNFGDGGYSTVANPTHTFTSAGNYLTCLEINDGTIPTSICNNVKVTTNTVCKTKILIDSVSGNKIVFNHETSGTQPFTYRWDFGDGFTSNQSKPAHTYSLSGRYLTKLTVVDALTDSATYSYHVNTYNSYSAAPNFSVNSITPIYTNPVVFSKIKISYTDENGKTFTSKSQQQPIGSNFQIESIEDFKTNEKGQLTKRIKIKFNCTLFNNTDKVIINNGEAVIAIAYK